MKIIKNDLEKLKNIFTVNLRRNAERISRIEAAFSRLNDENIEDDDFSPSRYTPSRNQLRKDIQNLRWLVHGYCVAVEDAFNIEYGTIEKRFYMGIDNDVHRLEEYEIIDTDGGQVTQVYLDAVDKADNKFKEFLFGNYIK